MTHRVAQVHAPLLALTLAVAACAMGDKPTDDAKSAVVEDVNNVVAATAPEWAKSATIYEVNVRQGTPDGTLKALEQELPRLRALGVDILWIMPVQPIGKAKRKGSLGSYYAIADYRGVNPEFGTRADMQALMTTAHKLGFKVILDWVANHSAFDHPWITEHPDFYAHNKDGTISNARDNEGHDTDWTDVAELDYDNPALRQAMIGDMRFWVDSLGMDGFRCDVAGGVSDDFWTEARDSLAARKPDLFWLAEAERPGAHRAFNATYGWEWHHLMNDVAKGKLGTDKLAAYVERQRVAYPAGAFRMYFTSDHDENSWNGSEFERMGANHEPAFILATTMERSFPLAYSGQEYGMSKRLRFFDKDTVPTTGPSLSAFYTAVFALKHAQPALANGSWGAPQVALDNTAGTKVYAFTRTTGANTVLVAVNFGDAPVGMAYSGLRVVGTYTDWFSKAPVQLAATGAIELPAHGWRVLTR